ncbi:glycosyltransferase family 2 protein [Vibrio hibernica]|uniref:glycosyltransferase family 2 protein n=1 Tax=Vibrio hibernica TaxID=2587465 RepID=UPI0018827019|nr:glycosyltransferase family 2 protein [Vibrio hibernica]
MMSKAKLSIVTICYNAEKDLPNTIKSVIDQGYKNVEYIIIDGGSSDNSLDIIKYYEELALSRGIVYKWLSERDQGIYDALNKGISLATGEWINFMNAGDRFVDSNVLLDIAPFLLESDDIVYGNTIDKLNDQNNRYSRAKTVDELYKGSIFCHQSCFVRLALHKEYPFNLNYNICADFDFFFRMYILGKRFKHVDKYIAIYDLNGISSNNLAYLKEMKSIVRYFKGKKAHAWYFYYLNAIFTLKYHLKKLLPSSLVVYIKASRSKK